MSDRIESGEIVEYWKDGRIIKGVVLGYWEDMTTDEMKYLITEGASVHVNHVKPEFVVE